MVKLTYCLLVATREGQKEISVVVSAKTFVEALAKAKKTVELDFSDYHVVSAYTKEVVYGS